MEPSWRQARWTPVADAWRDQCPGTVVTWRGGQREDISVAELLALEDIALAAWALPEPWLEAFDRPRKRHPREVHSQIPIVSWSNTPAFSDERFRMKLWRMNLCGVERHDDLWLITFSNTRAGGGFERVHPDGPSWIASLSLGRASGVALGDLGQPGYQFHVLDRDAPVVQWLCALRVAATSTGATVDPADVEACWLTTANKPWEMSDLIGKWASDPRVPDALKPPTDDRGNSLRLNVVKLGGRNTLSA